MKNKVISIGFLAILVMAAAALPVTAASTLDGQHHFIELAEDWQALGFDLDNLEPEFVATTPDGEGALITIQEGNAVAVVNHSNLVKIIALPDEAEPDGIAISPDGKVAVTANEEGQSISLINLGNGLASAELTTTVDVLQFLPMNDPNFKRKKGEVDPEGVTIFNQEGRRYAVLTLEKSASLLVLDVTDPGNVTNVSLLPVGFSGDEADPDDREAEPEGVAVSPSGDLIAVGNEEEGTVSLILIIGGSVPSFGERVNFDPSGEEAEIVSFTPDQKRLLVTNSKENTLIILNISDLTNISEERVLDLSGYGEPTSVAASPDGNYALVSVADGVNPTVNPGKVFAFCLTSYDLLAEFSVGQVPDSIGITPDGSYAFIANEAENEDDVPEDDGITGNISVINLTYQDDSLEPDTATTELSANVVPAISITVETSALDFGTVGAGLSSATSQIRIANTGAHDVSVTAGIGADESDFYATALRLNGASVGDFSVGVPADVTDFEHAENIVALLEVPEWAGGEYNGIVLFIATTTDNTDTEETAIELSNLSLQHPRRGHQLTLADGKLWVTGGKAYYSHFLNWGEGYQEFTTYPNVEYIDPVNGEAVYTDVVTKTEGGKAKEFYKATAFTSHDNDSIIYIAGDEKLLKFNASFEDTPGDAIIEIDDPGELHDWRESIWGRIAIGGKEYVVLIGEAGAFFFDPAIEQFVNLPGVVAEFPEMITDVVDEDIGGCVIGDKFYLFGGTMSDGSGSAKAWIFEPNAGSGDEWSFISDMPFGVKAPSVESVGGLAYIIGGLTTGYMYREIFEYDPTDDSYTRKVDLPCPTYKHDTAVFGDQIWTSYGYSWGTEEEGRYGFRMHPPHLVRYSPLCDCTVQDVTGAESVSGEKMNLNIGLPDPDNITGTEQTIAINWMASTDSTRGVAYFREVGETDWESVDAEGTSYQQVFSEAKAYTATLTGLNPETEYEYYAVSEVEGAEDVQSETYIYKTQPEDGDSFQFIAYGDSKAQYDVLHELNCQIIGELEEVIASGNGNGTNGTFVLQLGDFGAYSAMREWEAWFDYGFDGSQCTKEMTASYAFVPVHGNHEYLAPSWFNTFAMPEISMNSWPNLNNTGYEERWYSFNYGQAHIAVVTTGEYTGEDWYQTQLEWLDADLAEAKSEKDAGDIRWVIVAMHHSPFTSGDHFPDQDDYGLFEEGSYVDVIDSSGAVDVVLAAHDHDYERSKMIRGFRWTGEAEGTGEPAFYRLDNASVVAESERFGSANQGNGTVWLTLGGAGAGQRDMQELDDLGDSSWIAFRKPDPALGEDAETNPCFHYSVITVTPDVLEIEVFEQDISYLPDWTGADDDFEGLLDCVTIHSPT
jgi:DNA-binding beta-propeller fold protein YncE